MFEKKTFLPTWFWSTCQISISLNRMVRPYFVENFCVASESWKWNQNWRECVLGSFRKPLGLTDRRRVMKYSNKEDRLGELSPLTLDDDDDYNDMIQRVTSVTNWSSYCHFWNFYPVSVYNPESFITRTNCALCELQADSATKTFPLYFFCSLVFFDRSKISSTKCQQH